MLTTLIFILFGAAFLLLTGIGLYNMGRLSVKKSEDFRCLYCDTLVIGAQSSDKMFHLLCIDRAPADLEAVRKKSIAPKDEYFIEYFRKVRPSGADFDSYNYSHGTWWAWGYRVYRNGTQIFTGWHKTKTNATYSANHQIELDKHKQRTKALNG